MTAQQPAPLSDLSGQVERITYNDVQSGFTIAQIKVPSQPELVTAVGNLMAPPPGAVLQMKGQWTDHPRFGRQFRVHRFETRAPASEQGIEKYLGSGLIKGIGPTMARRIVRRFGENTLDIIEHHMERLTEVPGIGAHRLKTIRKTWERQREIRHVMLFLQSHGVSTSLVTKIFQRYGQRTIAVVSENPFRLANDIAGVGFLTADRIARQMGFAKNAALRIQAGILYVLQQLADEGHVYYPCNALLTKCRSILECGAEEITSALKAVAAGKKIVIEEHPGNGQSLSFEDQAVYLARFHFSEMSIAKKLRTLRKAPLLWPAVNTEQALNWVQRQLKLKLAPGQIKAVSMALRQKVLVITGGPGTGKTTIIQAITRLYERLRARVKLAAPTGRAAKRLSEAAGRPAQTLHRLLEYSPLQGDFQKNDKKPLDCELLIVDEVSMVDTLLMHSLLKAVPLHATLIFVGDANQLPSVGPGNVLKDMLESKAVPAVTLKEIFRQARASQIVTNAHRINAGRMPQLKPPKLDNLNDFYFIEQEAADKIADIIVTLAAERIPRRFGFDPVADIQVLTPMHRGIVGAENLNRRLQEALNPQENALMHGERRFRLHDKVMQIRNNYDKEVFNGDIGRIQHIDPVAKTLSLLFDERLVTYDFNDLDEIVLAYAVSVHKSQGSEYPAVVLPVTTQHYVLLQRNLIYTAVTRARRLAVLVGTPKALALAIKNDRAQQRHTGLCHRLSGSVRF